MKIAEYLRCTPDISWDYAKQMGVEYAVGRMPDGHMEETAESFEKLRAMKEVYDKKGFKLKVIEPAPLNSRIKLGLDGRDEEIERMCSLITNMGRLGIEVLCYNFAAHFNWVRTSDDLIDRGGALVTGYKHSDIDHSQFTEVGVLTKEQLWKNFEYLQKAIVPVAEKASVYLAVHPSDPPVDEIQHVARILTSPEEYERALSIVKSEYMGITMCQGTFTTMGVDISETIKRFGDKIRFVHIRDVSSCDKLDFCECFPDNGVNDMARCILDYQRYCPDAYCRIDHIPTLAGEDNSNPGYCYLGRLYGVGYLKGLLEMAEKVNKYE